MLKLSSFSSAKMTLPVRLIYFVILLSRVSTIEYSEKNIFCGNIKMGDGHFNYTHGCPVGAEISVSANKTTIAYAKGPADPPEIIPPVVSMDNKSVMTKECLDLQINCIIPAGGFVRETQLNIWTTGEIKKPDPESPPPEGFASEGKSFGNGGIIAIVISVIIGIIGITGISVILCRYSSWKKEMKKRREAATFVGFCRELVTHCACRKPTPLAETPDTGETRGSATPGDTTAVEMSDMSPVERPSAPEPHGSGGNDAEQDDTLVPLLSVHNIDPGSDIKTPHTRSLDRNSSNEGIWPTNKDDTIAPDVNRASDYRAMNRNLRDDPGGADHDEGRCSVRANSRGSDVPSEAVPLVDKGGLDQDPVSRCRDAPDTDVESSPKN